MADYVETTEDNGGVHLNSGIPNRAFHLAAIALGGNAWEGAGRIWYAALTGPAFRRGRRSWVLAADRTAAEAVWRAAVVRLPGA